MCRVKGTGGEDFGGRRGTVEMGGPGLQTSRAFHKLDPGYRPLEETVTSAMQSRFRAVTCCGELCGRVLQKCVLGRRNRGKREKDV